jgi:hypothetical protein
MDARLPLPDEVELFDQARELLEARHDPTIHQVAAAARTADFRMSKCLPCGRPLTMM